MVALLLQSRGCRVAAKWLGARVTGLLNLKTFSFSLGQFLEVCKGHQKG